MYLTRKIDAYLDNWFLDKEKKPLIVKGSRQIGKTESIKKFAHSHYKHFIEINFALEKKYTTICSDGYDVDSVIKNISLIDRTKVFVPNETLILFDEIQDYPDIASSLKSFNQDRRFDCICSGSMLGINYQKIHSNSVGNKSEYQMQSMDFEEFLWAMGYDDTLSSTLLDHMLMSKPLGETLKNVLYNLFLDYMITGGMPAVVKSFVEKKTFQDTLTLQKELLADYEEDIKKYLEGLDKTKVLNVFESIPVQLAKENKKFQISKISSGSRFRDYWGAIEWLNDSGMINICYSLHTPDLPLKGNYESDKYKIYFKDTGLLVASLDEESQDDLRVNKNINVYKGALWENAMGECLSKQGYDLFYYKKDNSTLEEDFFVRTKKSLVPIEIKATNGNSKSLQTLIKSDSYPDIKEGIKLANSNIGFENNIHTFPHFCGYLLKRYLKEVDF